VILRALWLTLCAMVAALFLTLLMGCSSSFEVTGLVRIQPPYSYRAVWDSAQACTGRHGRFEDLDFFVGESLHSDQGSLAGHTSGHRIYIAAGFERNPLVVKHEMIHALGVNNHPLHPFVVPCRATWESYRGDGKDLGE
jgi:hypothetical protein